ncbi:hypothetical protein MESS2_980035 [Mesorhizobium metallidurans STM 2683]|uniref:Uncharacterized protein n=1 Tax=Mesorhizobium metallidurans STM 2683 TaxID=1297569 RepID=M5EZ20_9HYPH|nr:hypothetical protein MESS2_980035 [Mesorhizobium metallidurans STM 2683]
MCGVIRSSTSPDRFLLSSTGSRRRSGLAVTIDDIMPLVLRGHATCHLGDCTYPAKALMHYG